jgi:hypothetical protein
MCVLTTKLGTELLFALAIVFLFLWVINLKILLLIVSVDDLRDIGLLGDSIIWVRYSGTL